MVVLHYQLLLCYPVIREGLQKEFLFIDLKLQSYSHTLISSSGDRSIDLSISPISVQKLLILLHTL